MSANKPSLFSSLLSPLTGADRLALEKARLEAFLNAYPGEYCGFHEDGTVAYSDGFRALFGLQKIENVEDIQSALATVHTVTGIIYFLQFMAMGAHTLAMVLYFMVLMLLFFFMASILVIRRHFVPKVEA